MITRRKFVQLAAALPALVRPLRAETHIPIGLQLYTLRQMAEKDLSSVLHEIRAAGYEQVELTSQVYTHPAKQLQAMIADSGLTAPSGHFEYAGFAANFSYAKSLGLKWLVCPMIPEDQWTADGFRRAAQRFNALGKRARDMGMNFAFHNHDYEFRKIDGNSTGYDILVKETDPEVVSFELDCYWVAQAGLDPTEMLRHLGRRVRMLHLKDLKPGFPPSNDMTATSAHFTEVGRGKLHWPEILAQAQRLQVEHYFVEQDKTDGPPLKSIRISYEYLRKILP
jgi:sugar phosphate isomerase/epimerase